jgi:hypothetical protein
VVSGLGPEVGRWVSLPFGAVHPLQSGGGG